jgi:hypothetical protein
MWSFAATLPGERQNLVECKLKTMGAEIGAWQELSVSTDVKREGLWIAWENPA